MKSILKGLGILVIAGILLTQTVFGEDIKKVNPVEITDVYTFLENGYYMDSKDETQYYEFNTVDNIRTKLDLPNCEAILAVNDEFIIYTGVQGRLYAADKKSKRVKTIGDIGKDSYKKLELDCANIKGDYFYYALKNVEIGGLLSTEIKKINIKTKENEGVVTGCKWRIYFIDDQGIYFTNVEKDKDGNLQEEFYIMRWDDSCISQIMKCSKIEEISILEDKLLLRGLKVQDEKIAYVTSEYITVRKVEDFMHEYDREKQSNPLVIDQKTIHYGMRVLLQESSEGEYSFELNPRIDSVSNYFKNNSLNKEEWEEYGVLLQKINPLNINKVSIERFPAKLHVQEKEEMETKKEFVYINFFGKDELSLGYIDKEKWQLVIIEENITRPEYMYGKYFFGNDLILFGDDIYYYVEKENQRENYLWNYPEEE